MTKQVMGQSINPINPSFIQTFGP